MANWENLNLTNLFPQEIDDLAGDIASVGSSVGTVLSTFGTAVSALATLVVDFDDPISAISKALVDSINALITDLKDTAVFALPVGPDNFEAESRGGLPEFQRRIVESLSDFSDFQRPKFSDAGAVGAIIIATAAPSLNEFKPLVSKIEQLFSIGKRFTRFSNFDGVGFGTAQTLFPVIGTGVAQNIPITSSSGFSRNGGFGQIEDEQFAYERLTNITGRWQLEKVILQEDHDAFSEIIAIRSVDGVKPKAVLTVPLLPSTDLQDIAVDSTDDFPTNGIINNEVTLTNYLSKSGTEFKDCLISMSHAIGEVVLLKGTNSATGQPPDWEKKQIVNVMPVVGEVYRTLESFAQLLKPMEEISGLLSELGGLLTAKGNLITSITQEIQDGLDFLTSILTGTGISILTISPEVGGLTAFRNSVTTATSKPDWPKGFYVAGIVLLVGSETLGVAQTQFAILETLF